MKPDDAKGKESGTETMPTVVTTTTTTTREDSMAADTTAAAAVAIKGDAEIESDGIAGPRDLEAGSAEGDVLPPNEKEGNTDSGARADGEGDDSKKLGSDEDGEGLDDSGDGKGLGGDDVDKDRETSEQEQFGGDTDGPGSGGNDGSGGSDFGPGPRTAATAATTTAPASNSVPAMVRVTMPLRPTSPPSLSIRVEDGHKKTTPPRRDRTAKSSSASDVAGASPVTRGGGGAGSRSLAGIVANRNTRMSASAIDEVGFDDASTAAFEGGASSSSSTLSSYVDWSGMTQEELLQALYENPELAKAARDYEEQMLTMDGDSSSFSSAGFDDEERVARRERIKKRQEARAKVRGEMRGEGPGESGDAASSSKYYRSADETAKKIRSQPAYLEDMMERGVPIKSWLVVCALLGVGLFQLRRALKEPTVGDLSLGKGPKHAKKAITEARGGSPSKKRGAGKAKGKKAAGGKPRSFPLRKGSKGNIDVVQRPASQVKEAVETPKNEPSPPEVVEEEKKEADSLSQETEHENLEKEHDFSEVKAEDNSDYATPVKKKSPKKKRARKKPQEQSTAVGETVSEDDIITPSALLTDSSESPPPITDTAHADNDRSDHVEETAESLSVTQRQGVVLDGMDEKDRLAVMEALGDEGAHDEGGWQTAGRRKANKKKNSARGGGKETVNEAATTDKKGSEHNGERKKEMSPARKSTSAAQEATSSSAGTDGKLMQQEDTATSDQSPPPSFDGAQNDGEDKVKDGNFSAAKTNEGTDKVDKVLNESDGIASSNPAAEKEKVNTVEVATTTPSDENKKGSSIPNGENIVGNEKDEVGSERSESKEQPKNAEKNGKSKATHDAEEKSSESAELQSIQPPTADSNASSPSGTLSPQPEEEDVEAEAPCTEDDAALARMLQMEEESRREQQKVQEAEEGWEEVVTKKGKRRAATTDEGAAMASPHARQQRAVAAK